MTKPKKCKSCKLPFTPTRPLQIACGYLCAILLVKLKTDKKARKALKDGRIALKSRSEWLKDAQIVFNKFIRLRDILEPCISSGRPLCGKFDAGHFRTVGAAGHLRFNEDNCHGQTVHDNQHLSGNLLAYRRGLIERIGLERVEALENNNETRKYTIDDAKEIIRIYKEKACNLC